MLEIPTLEMTFRMVLGLIEEIDKQGDYPTRYKFILQALVIARELGYGGGIDLIEADDPNTEAVEAACRIVVYIDLPTPDGETEQISWHMPQYLRPWDGHTKEEKYARIDRYLGR